MRRRGPEPAKPVELAKENPEPVKEVPQLPEIITVVHNLDEEGTEWNFEPFFNEVKTISNDNISTTLVLR
jgi:hypothetical protein